MFGRWVVEVKAGGVVNRTHRLTYRDAHNLATAYRRMIGDNGTVDLVRA